MNKLLLFLTLCFFSFVTLQAQLCTPDDITLSTQAEVDSFQINYGTCDTVTGDLRIEGADITNLDSLTGLKHIGGFLRVFVNPMLTNVDGLTGLTSVERIDISGNDALTNVDGLSNITYVWNGISISGNGALTNLDGLANITSSPSIFVQLQFNFALTNVDGLAGITSVEELVISQCFALTNVDGLSNLTYAIAILLQYNDALTNVDGLANLTSVGNAFRIRNNNSLVNVDGLANLTSVGNAFRIHDNPILALCCGALPVLESGNIGGPILIENNLPGCDSEAEILAANCAYLFPPIPTMSQWAMLLFGLIVLTLGMVGLYNVRLLDTVRV
jgi:hypothetical protein